ncbi:unnamed protein product [Linum tenue]|uniref:F-box domain-containing protein n=1 Tax=Linum tenue TaxID=586396 RepID=A0AAV0P8V9_9ROSI|nr:unnamed protein product [Linum tenue]
MEKNTGKLARNAEWKVRAPGIDDRLNSLPDEIISHILSFLETKFAVGTAVLSRRWKDLWTMVSNLDFNNRLTYKDLIGSGDADDSLPEETEERKAVRFFGFVERVLRQHSNLDSLGRFRFHFSASEGNCKVMQGCLDKMELVFGSQIEAIEWWVWDATRFRNLPSIWRLPESFYTLKNLKDVNLHHVIMGADGPVSLPSLKNLNLWKAKFTDFDSLSRLTSGCPVLETLCLEYCAVVDANENDFLIASMPSLRNLRIVGLGNDGYEDLCPIAMEAPMLTDLYLEDFSELQFLGSSGPLPCLCSARVDTNEGGGSYDSLIRLLTQISNVKEMCLDRKTLVMISFPKYTILFFVSAGS